MKTAQKDWDVVLTGTKRASNILFRSYIYIYGILTSCTRDLGKRFYFMTRKKHVKSVYSSTSFSHLFSATAVPKFLSIMLLCWLINSVWCFLDNFELTADNKCRYISGHISLGSEKNTNEKTLGDLEMYIYIYIEKNTYIQSDLFGIKIQKRVRLLRRDCWIPLSLRIYMYKIKSISVFQLKQPNTEVYSINVHAKKKATKENN